MLSVPSLFGYAEIDVLTLSCSTNGNGIPPIPGLFSLIIRISFFLSKAWDFLKFGRNFLLNSKLFPGRSGRLSCNLFNSYYIVIYYCITIIFLKTLNHKK